MVSKKQLIKKQITLFKLPIHWTLIAIAMVLASGMFILFKSLNTTPPTLEYRIKIAELSQQTLAVRMTIGGAKPDQDFILYKGTLQPFDISGRDGSGRNLPVKEETELVKIKAGHTTKIILNYFIRIGHPGKHGLQGFSASDLVTFSGERVFLLPLNAITDSDRVIRRNISKIKIQTVIPAHWTAVFPYAFHGRGNNAVIPRPTWSDLYDMMKSCYAFSRFCHTNYSNPCGKLNIYMAPGLGSNDTTAIHGIQALYDYYCRLFGTAPPVLSVALFPRERGSNSYIMGGSGIQTIGATFDSNNSRDWQLLAHRLYHAFFDSRVTTPAFHLPPRLWLNEGLATYYENAALESLPVKFKRALHLSMESGFNSLADRYLYFRIKDQSLLSLAPTDETQIQESGGRTEFLHYTQAPLLVKIMEDVSYRKHNRRNRLLHFILSSANRNLQIPEIVNHALGSESGSFIKLYLENPGILPVWYLGGGQAEPPDLVIRQFNEFEHTLWTWFRLEYPSYPLDYIDEGRFSYRRRLKATAAAEQQGICFGPADLEAKIKRASPVTYQLLKQYALRADMCKVDFNDPLLRFKLSSDPVNLTKWRAFQQVD